MVFFSCCQRNFSPGINQLKSGTNGESEMSAHNGAVCINCLVDNHHESTATNEAQMIRALRDDGVAIGSVIMKKANSSSEPVLSWCKKKSVGQPKYNTLRI